MKQSVIHVANLGPSRLREGDLGMDTSDHAVNAVTVWGVNRRRVNTWDETGMRYNYTLLDITKSNHSTSRVKYINFCLSLA
jgi:hypothetical protein